MRLCTCSLLPQFVGHGTLPALLALGALFNAMGVLWLTGYALVAARGRAFLQRPGVKVVLDYLSAPFSSASGCDSRSSGAARPAQ